MIVQRIRKWDSLTVGRQLPQPFFAPDIHFLDPEDVFMFLRQLEPSAAHAVESTVFVQSGLRTRPFRNQETSNSDYGVGTVRRHAPDPELYLAR